MNDKQWNRAANAAGISAIIAIFLYLWRLMSGSIDVLTVIIFAFVITAAIAFIFIHLIILIRKSTPASVSVSNQVSETKEFVTLFISQMVMLLTAITILFFSNKHVAGTVIAILLVTMGISLLVKVYHIQRLTREKMKSIRLEQAFDFTKFSTAEKVAMGVMGVSFLGMFFVPSLALVIYLGGLVFLVRPFVKHTEARFVDLILTVNNIIIILVSLLLMIAK